MAAPLFRRHAAGLAATFADIENHAMHQDHALIGTPGSITVRTNAGGIQYYVRQHYDFEGRKRDQYLGARPGTPAGDALLKRWATRLEEENELRSSIRLLVREGFAVLPPKPMAAVAALSNFGVFKAGAMLVGTHAFSVIVNRLGIRAAAFATEDVDVARPARLGLPQKADATLLEMLRQSGIDFVDVPGFPHGMPSAKIKERGRSRFLFDLLVPAAGTQSEVVFVPELAAHASALPYFRYLVSESQVGAALSLRGVAEVRVPLPERYALHKMIVSQLRRGRPEKSRKDLAQAAILVAALGELQPGALEEAFRKTASSMRSHIRKSADSMEAMLGPHPQSAAELRACVKRASGRA